MRHGILSVLMALMFGITFIVPINDGNAAFNFLGSHKKVKDIDGKILISLTDIDDGKAHYFQYKNDDTTVKFFVVKSGDGVIRAAFDACDVCFPSQKGYSQDEDFMICNNCGRRFHSSRINIVEGGCNPAPLSREVVADNLVLKVEDIIQGARYF